MKFRFRPSSARKCLKSPEAKRKLLRLRGINTLKVKKEKSLAINYAAEDFGTFGQEKRKGLFAELFKKIKLWTISFKVFFKKRSRKKRAPMLSTTTLLGALCSALTLTLISGTVVIFSFFFKYGGSYTEVAVPDLTAMNINEAMEVSNELFEYTVVYEENPDRAPGSVISQSPLPNVTRKLYVGNDKIHITLIVNKEQPTLELPRVIGTSLRDTALALKNFGINVQVIEQYSDTVPYGTVFFSSLPQGSTLNPGDKIILKASIGKQTRYCQVPELFGLDEYEAASLLKSKNLTVGDIKYENSKLPIGTVISQDTAPDTTLPEGSKISFTLSGGIYY